MHKFVQNVEHHQTEKGRILYSVQWDFGHDHGVVHGPGVCCRTVNPYPIPAIAKGCDVSEVRESC